MTIDREVLVADVSTSSEQAPGSSGVARARNLVILALAVIALVVGTVSLPVQVHLPRGHTELISTVQTLAPQGWAFFTRDPREPLVVPYVPSADGWQDVSRGPNVQPRHLFGADRTSRLTEFDTQLVLAESPPEDAWVDCGVSPADECVDQVRAQSETVPVTTAGWDLALCGPVLLVRRHPVPLAYAGVGGEQRGEALLFDVRCEERS